MNFLRFRTRVIPWTISKRPISVTPQFWRRGRIHEAQNEVMTPFFRNAQTSVQNLTP